MADQQPKADVAVMSITTSTRVQLGLTITFVTGIISLFSWAFMVRAETTALFSEAMKQIEESRRVHELNAARFTAAIERTNESLDRTNTELRAIHQALEGIDSKTVLRANLIYWIDALRDQNARGLNGKLTVPPFPKK